MYFLRILTLVLSACCVVGLLAPSVQAANEFSLVYSFKNAADGQNPLASVINVGGTLYGVTESGGDTNNCAGIGCGTVFKVTLAGVKTILYAFHGGTDGAYPQAALVELNGALYGTTGAGGNVSGCSGVGCGTVFQITTEGVLTTVYRFAGGTDAADPYGALVAVGHTLYGTTAFGGTNNNGAVFRVTPLGAEAVVYSFAGGADGANPAANLINVSGVLYSTTYGGGTHGKGTVFKVTQAGAKTTLYNFKGGKDGANPYTGLIKVGIAYYGTTYNGGHVAPSCKMGCGTVFKLTAAGVEKVLYSFKGGNSDGSHPANGSNLINVGGTLYGVNVYDGSGGCADGTGDIGCGTIYKVTTTGTETVLHTFTADANNGFNPYGALISLDGSLYGTTQGGGSQGFYGAVFKLTP